MSQHAAVTIFSHETHQLWSLLSRTNSPYRYNTVFRHFGSICHTPPVMMFVFRVVNARSYFGIHGVWKISFCLFAACVILVDWQLKASWICYLCISGDIYAEFTLHVCFLSKTFSPVNPKFAHFCWPSCEDRAATIPLSICAIGISQRSFLQIFCVVRYG